MQADRKVRMPRLVSAAAVCLSIAVSAWAQTTVGPDELRKAASDALQAGQARKALEFGQALTARDPSDLSAHLILARASRDLGDMPPARASARRAWRLAKTDPEKYAAALVTAQVLSSDNKRTRAQLWLRRAAEHAPNDLLRAKAKRDFGYVKQRNPWRTDLTFTFAPNSNINNGSARDRSLLNYEQVELVFGELREAQLGTESQAIAGLEIGGTVRTRYRFHQTPTTAHDAKVALSYRTYTITDDLDPIPANLITGEGPREIKGGDFAYGSLSFGYGYRQMNMDRRGEFSMDAEAGQTWYGGNRYASFLRLQSQQSVILEGNRRLRFGADLERQWGQSTADVDSAGVSANITRAFASGNSGFVGLYLRGTQSPVDSLEYGEVTLRTGIALRKPVMGAALQLGLGVSFRDYDVSRHSPDGRQDNRLFADVTAVFKEIDYYGFNPTVTLSASSTDSNIGLYDVNRVGLNIGIRSAF